MDFKSIHDTFIEQYKERIISLGITNINIGIDSRNFIYIEYKRESTYRAVMFVSDKSSEKTNKTHTYIIDSTLCYDFPKIQYNVGNRSITIQVYMISVMNEKFCINNITNQPYLICIPTNTVDLTDFVMAYTKLFIQS